MYSDYMRIRENAPNPPLKDLHQKNGNARIKIFQDTGSDLQVVQQKKLF